jgi:glutamine amidotransferase
LLCVCLGLQLLFQQSDEAPEASGLGLLPGRVGRFEKARVVPHMGWNRVCADPDARFLRSGYAYFAHSYRLLHSPPGSRVATCTQSERFVAGFEHAGVLACQFHPELSGSYGRQLLGAWLAAAFAEEQSAC